MAGEGGQRLGSVFGGPGRRPLTRVAAELGERHRYGVGFGFGKEARPKIKVAGQLQ